MTQNHIIFGPPGTGKTHWIADQVVRAVEKYGEHKVMVASLTKAGAKQASRACHLPDEQVGTLHSIAYHGLGCPTIAEGKLKEWNEEFPHWQLEPENKSVDDPYDRPREELQFYTKSPEEMKNEYARLRTVQVPREGWPGDVKEFASRWEDWKEQCGYVDFTDLLETALHSLDSAPGQPAVVFIDEGQDFGPLEIALVRHWAASAEHFVAVLDPHQQLFSWRGADASWSYQRPPDGVRKQSYRVPRAVHKHALVWMGRTGVPPVEYYPRDYDGLVTANGATYQLVEPLLPIVEQYLKQNKTVMFLATCGYMLHPLMKRLRQEGIKYHNPWRPTNGQWNPLAPRKGAFSDKLLAFLRPSREVYGEGARFWTPAELKTWAGILPARDIFKPRQKAKLESMGENVTDVALAQHLQEWFLPEALRHILDFDVAWYCNTASSAPTPREFVQNIVEKRGVAAVAAPPQIALGTVHCSPGDEQVLTVGHGYVAMSDLDPQIHRLVSYRVKDNGVTWGGNTTKKYGFTFSVAKNHYEGPLLTLTTGETKTRVTPDHRIRVRYAEAFFNKWVVYLMRKGNWWRIGVCTSARRPYISGGVGGRIATEKADCGWILKVCESRHEAMIEEARIQGYYGIPSLTFWADKARGMTTDELHWIHTAIAIPVNMRMQKLAEDFGIVLNHPLYYRSNRRQYKNIRAGNGFEIVAANFLSGYMDLPVTDTIWNKPKGVPKINPRWLTGSVTRSYFSGAVYSLDVEKYEHYVSGGAIVHNSLKGSEASVAVVFPDLSPAAYHTDEQGQYDVARTFYVAVTRAREDLILCAPQSHMAVTWKG